MSADGIAGTAAGVVLVMPSLALICDAAAAAAAAAWLALKIVQITDNQLYNYYTTSRK